MGGGGGSKKPTHIKKQKAVVRRRKVPERDRRGGGNKAPLTFERKRGAAAAGGAWTGWDRLQAAQASPPTPSGGQGGIKINGAMWRSHNIHYWVDLICWLRPPPKKSILGPGGRPEGAFAVPANGQKSRFFGT